VKYKPHDYQINAIGKMVEEPELGLFMDPGLGKTSCTLGMLTVLKQAGVLNNMLVVCPLRPLYAVWPAEVEKWSDFKHFSVGILHGPRKAEVLLEKHDIYLINPEGIKWLSERLKGFKSGSKFPFDALVIDESTRFKNTRTQRFKALKTLLGKFTRRYILTGTPAPNGLLDLFGQMYCLDMGASLGKYITHFRMRHFVDVGRDYPDWKLREGEEKRIYDYIESRVLRMDQKDYLELPELIIRDHWIDLPLTVMEKYKELEDHFILQLKAGQVTAVNAAALTIKLRQIANGGVYTESGTWENLHYEKAKVALELVEELSGQKTLIAYDFKHDFDRLQSVFKSLLAERHESPSRLGSGVSVRKAKKIIKGWNEGNTSIIFGHPASVSHGLNLQAGRAVVFHSLTWDLEQYEQFIRRVWRQGQTERVFVHRILARGTIDEVMVEALKRKDKTQSTLLNALKKRYSWDEAA